MRAGSAPVPRGEAPREPGRRTLAQAASAGPVGKVHGHHEECGRGPVGAGATAGAANPRPRPGAPYGEKDTVSGISVMPLYFSIASFMRLSLWPRRLFHSAHQLRKFLKVESGSERIPK